MARPGWLNDNEYRSYPFIPQDTVAVTPSGVQLPHELIVEAVFLMGLEADYDEQTDAVYLHEIRRLADHIEIEFRTTADGAAAYALIFEREFDAEEWTTSDAGAGVIDSGSDSSDSYTCGETPRWEGALTTGKLDALLTLLPLPGDSLTYTAGEWQLEPARIQNLKKAFLQSIGLANVDRTRWTADTECEEGEATGDRAIYVNTGCMDGPIRWKEGYNCSIRQDDTNNTITIGAVKGAGAGLACEEVPLYVGETAPDGSSVLSGGPTCTEVLKTLNGVGGRIVRIVGGSGIRITTDELSPHTVFVNVTLQGFAYCPKTE